jgi:hypothetical protein
VPPQNPSRDGTLFGFRETPEYNGFQAPVKPTPRLFARQEFDLFFSRREGVKWIGRMALGRRAKFQ